MLTGKKILVTGASSGIGRATAKKLLNEGAEVYGLCRSVEKLPDGVKGLPCDLLDTEQIDAAFSQLSELDALVNNAGSAYLAAVTTGDPILWEKMWRLNVHALTYCTKLALPLFSANGGHVLNVSSMSGHRVPPTGGFYAATKFAVRAITEATRAELKAAGSRTRVSSISPGFVDTPLLDHYFMGREQQLKETKQNIKMLTAGDIADSIVHILKSPSRVEINDIQLRSNDQAI